MNRILLVYVWNHTHLELALWDGDMWRTLSNTPLPGVTHWRERTPDQVTA